MEENEARRVVAALRQRGVPAHLEMAKAGLSQFGVRVALFDGRTAVWDTGGTAGLEALLMRDGMLVGFVPMIEGSEHYTEAQVVDAIAGTDYDRPVARRQPAAPRPQSPKPPLPPAREGGFFSRFRI